MTKLILLTLLTLASQPLAAQPIDTFLISNKEIKDFFNDTKFLGANNGMVSLSDEPSTRVSQNFLSKIIARDSVFSKSDIDFISKQINQRQKAVWNQSLVDSVTIIKASEVDSIFKKNGVDKGWQAFHKTYKGNLYRASLPYFSVDKRTCVVCIGYSCGGICGEGNIWILRQTKNRWTLYKTIWHWIS